MSEIKKYRVPLTLLISFFIFFLFFWIRNFQEKREIINNGIETIGFVTNTTTRRSAQSIEYIYYYESKKIEGIDTEQEGPLSGYLGRYFKVVLSSENPNHSIILLNVEVTDSRSIKEAGFDVAK